MPYLNLITWYTIILISQTANWTLERLSSLSKVTKHSSELRSSWPQRHICFLPNLKKKKKSGSLGIFKTKKQNKHKDRKPPEFSFPLHTLKPLFISPSSAKLILSLAWTQMQRPAENGSKNDELVSTCLQQGFQMQGLIVIPEEVDHNVVNRKKERDDQSKGRLQRS